jgi:hypothetical protein
MSLIIHQRLEDVYDLVCSKKFLKKIYLLDDNANFKKSDDGKKITFERMYSYKDLNKLEAVEVPDNFVSIIETNLQNIQICMHTEHEIIKHTDKCFIVKYTSVLNKPEYVEKILRNTRIVLYVQFNTNINDSNMTVIHFNKKLVNTDEEDDDTCIMNADHTDIITNIYQQETLNINPNIISFSETFLGNSLVHEFILPFIKSIFNTSFGILQDVYTLRFIKYVSKKGIDIYKKKG